MHSLSGFCIVYAKNVNYEKAICNIVVNDNSDKRVSTT